jgi:hypothetical protein
MDTYYEAIKAFTFETKFVPFSMVDAKALMEAYDHFVVSFLLDINSICCVMP